MKQNTKYKKQKAIFDAFVEKGLYLPKYQLKKISSDKAFNIQDLDEYIKYHPKLKWYTSKDTAGYSLEYKDWFQEVSKKIQCTSVEDGTKKTHNSLYEAAKWLGDIKYVGNICMAAQREGKAYGYEWRYK